MVESPCWRLLYEDKLEEMGDPSGPFALRLRHYGSVAGRLFNAAADAYRYR